jgi:hypothetical protein
MKVFGVTDGKYFIASAGHHDCVAIADLMVDGGQAGAYDYAGYVRTSGTPCWAEIKDLTFAEFYTDYKLNGFHERQYGIWMLKPLAGECQVRILDKEEVPDYESMYWRKEMAIWGTRGKDGTEKLKYIHLKEAETEHLKNIIKTQIVAPHTFDVIIGILEDRWSNLLQSSTI